MQERGQGGRLSFLDNYGQICPYTHTLGIVWINYAWSPSGRNPRWIISTKGGKQ